METVSVKIDLGEETHRILEEVVQRQKQIDSLQNEIKELMQKILDLPLRRETV